MGGRAMVPLESLSLELPGGGIVVGYDDKDAAALQLQEEISALRSRQRRLDRRRRDALDKLIDLKGSIRVFCRVRPLIPTTSNLTTPKSPVTVEQEKIAVVQSAGINKEFVVDRVFNQESTQEDVFLEVRPVLRSALDGHNVCILAYGQTGTGKTYTMEGTDGGSKLGVVPRAIQELFSHASEEDGGSSTYTFSISMLEVYLGSLRDLLAPRQPLLFRHTDCASNNISILATKTGAVELEGLTDVSVPDLKKANQWYCRGRRARSTSWTNVNDLSSRSHCLTRITIRRRQGAVVTDGGGGGEVSSKLWLVDLGGSERLLKTGASGLTMDEGKAINLSLSALGDVIAALRRKRSHVPYRNSKLTQILSDSLGDGSRVLMMVHISASEDDVSETVCSLSFAERARSIKSNPNVSDDLKMLRQQRLAELDREIRDTEEELRHVNEQIRSAEISLEEKKKRKLSSSDALSDDEKGSPRSTLVVVGGHIDGAATSRESPRAAAEKLLPVKKQSRLSSSNGSVVPHFMSPTACSRHRHNAVAVGTHSVSSTKPRLTKSVTTLRYYPAELTSQSFVSSSYSGCKNNAAANKAASTSRSAVALFSSASSVSRSKHLAARCDQINTSSNSIESTAASAAPNNKRRGSGFISSRRAPLHQHRRMMSSLT